MRFRLETLLLATLVLAASMATFGALIGLALAVAGLSVVKLCFEPREGTVFVLGCAMIGAVVLCGLPSGPIGKANRSEGCFNNLKQIALGLHNYHDLNQSFPPAAFLKDRQGKPMHSWRVMIVPYLESSDRYPLYLYGEPWDGPNNRRLVDMVYSDCYRCPSARTASSFATSYVAVVGSNAAWSRERGRRFDEFKDGTSNTILLVEVADFGIHWMEPRDLTIEELLAALRDSRHRKEMASPHGCAFHVALADGSARALPRDISPKTLRALLTINGGEPIDWNSPEFDLDRPVPFWWAPAAAMVASYALLIRRLRAHRKRDVRIEPTGTDNREPTTDNHHAISP